MNAESLMQVRNRSHAPLNECRAALTEANDNVEQALVVLQKRGVIRAAASAVRDAKEGVVCSYVHGGKIAVLVEVNCETDFAARNPLFTQFVDEVAMHIAAANPPYLSRNEVTLDKYNQAREIAMAGMPPNKPEAVIAKILDGKMEKFFSDVCLVDQASLVSQNGKSIEQLRAQLSSQLGENVVIRRFTRWELGS